MSAADKPKWVDNRTLVYTWLFFAFPVGLFAVWKGSLFDDQMRWKITGGVVAVLILLIFTGSLPFFARIVFPAVGIYLCWKDPDIANSTTYMFAGAAVVLLLVFVLTNGATNPDQYPSPSPKSSGGDCTTTFTRGSCTYFRDSQCNVIGQYCE